MIFTLKGIRERFSRISQAAFIFFLALFVLGVPRESNAQYTYSRQQFSRLGVLTRAALFEKEA